LDNIYRIDAGGKDRRERRYTACQGPYGFACGFLSGELIPSDLKCVYTGNTLSKVEEYEV
jgi:hypothetical protein